MDQTILSSNTFLSNGETRRIRDHVVQRLEAAYIRPGGTLPQSGFEVVQLRDAAVRVYFDAPVIQIARPSGDPQNACFTLREGSKSDTLDPAGDQIPPGLKSFHSQSFYRLRVG